MLCLVKKKWLWIGKVKEKGNFELSTLQQFYAVDWNLLLIHLSQKKSWIFWTVDKVNKKHKMMNSMWFMIFISEEKKEKENVRNALKLPKTFRSTKNIIYYLWKQGDTIRHYVVANIRHTW